MISVIKIEYNGEYPNLCSGDLVVIIDDKRWEFPSHCMRSGGNVWFDKGWDEHVDSGEWSISEWLEGFPEDMKQAVTSEVNSNIRHGCCGGCV